MIDKSIKKEYEKLAPSEECFQRILKRAQTVDNSQNFRKSVLSISRMGYVAAAFLFVIALAFLVSSGMFDGGKFGVYYNGDIITEEYVIAKAERIEYASSGVLLARHDNSAQAPAQTANDAVTLELCGKNANVTVTDGVILVYDETLGIYVDVGETLEFTGKTKVVWALPEPAADTYQLTVTGEDKTYSILASARADKIMLKIK